jgi:hypothetical protein
LPNQHPVLGFDLSAEAGQGATKMKLKLKVLNLIFGVVSVGLFSSTVAQAQCGVPRSAMPAAAVKGSIKPASFQLGSGMPMLHAADFDLGLFDPIVGLWKVKFVTQNSPGIPDGVEVDHGYSAWHGDKTEFLNSARAPVNGSFCLGVWEKVGRSTYKLNHYAMAFMDDGKTPAGTVNIREEVTVDWSGNRYIGTFSIDGFDTNGVHLPMNQPGSHANGVITGVRITLETAPNDH